MSEVNQVRQVLMNELGLTRDSVRGMAEEIVRECVNQKVAKMMAEGHIERMVNEAINNIAKDSKWDTSAVRNLIAEAAGKAVRESVFQSLCR